MPAMLRVPPETDIWDHPNPVGIGPPTTSTLAILSVALGVSCCESTLCSMSRKKKKQTGNTAFGGVPMFRGTQIEAQETTKPCRLRRQRRPIACAPERFEGHSLERPNLDGTLSPYKFSRTKNHHWNRNRAQLSSNRLLGFHEKFAAE